MAYVDTGLGWYLDGDYLRTVGNTVLCTFSTPGTSIAYQSTTPGEVLYTTSLGDYPVTKYNDELGYFVALTNVSGWSGAWVGISKISTQGCGIMWQGGYQNNNLYFVRDGVTYYVNTVFWGQGFTPAGNVPTIDMHGQGFNINSTASQDLVIAWTAGSSGGSKDAVKVQGGAGAFAIVTYPHDGENVHVAVGISSIGIPNSAATIAVDGVNGRYNTFMRDGIEFTMYYTEQFTGTFTANVPVVTLDSDISSIPALYEARLFLAVANAAHVHTLPIPGEDDPYAGGGTSEPGGGNGTFDFDSTAIDFGTPPSIMAAGMVELYIPSTSDLAALAQYLWAGSFDPDNFKKLFADPMDAIIGLQIVPVTATEIGTTSDTLYVGNISTGLSMPKASSQYVTIDCGSLSIPRRLGSYLDYSPHTEMQLYLPYIGFVDISPDDCMGGTVSVKYMVDIIGGTCVAQVKCNNHVLYEFAAACSCQVPVSAGQYQNIVLGAVRGGVALVSGILGAAGGGLFSGLSEAADAALSMTKPKIQRSGGFGGSSGLMGHQKPYIIYTVPRLIVPGSQNNFIGYPSYITRMLGTLTGFTQIDSIHLSGIPASQSEQAEIERLLHEGVYL